MTPAISTRYKAKPEVELEAYPRVVLTAVRRTPSVTPVTSITKGTA
jgi:hypothetical protein